MLKDARVRLSACRQDDADVLFEMVCPLDLTDRVWLWDSAQSHDRGGSLFGTMA